MSLDESISQLIGRIYEGAFDAQSWDWAVDRLLQVTDTRFALIALADVKRKDLNHTNFAGLRESRFADGIAEYMDHMHLSDPTMVFAAQNPNARYCDTELHFPRFHKMEDPYIRWQHDRIGSIHCQLSYSAPEDGITFAVAVHQPASADPMPERNKRLSRLLFDHMERAQRLSCRPPDLSSESRALLVVDGRGRICESSPAAQWLISTGGGLAIRDRRLSATRARDTARIDLAIRSALDARAEGTAGGALSIARPSGMRDWLLTVSPLPQIASFFRILGPSAIVQIVDPEATAPRDPGVVWQTLFALTPAEARLASAFAASDDDLRQTAERSGIAYETARVHLKRIFEKTGTRSQTQLLRLLLRTG